MGNDIFIGFPNVKVHARIWIFDGVMLWAFVDIGIWAPKNSIQNSMKMYSDHEIFATYLPSIAKSCIM